MFDLPESKAVRRSELDSPHSSRASSPTADVSGSAAAAQAKLAAYFFSLYGQPNIKHNEADIDPSSDNRSTKESVDADETDGTVAFRLFSTSATTAAEPSRILIRSPTPENEEPGIIAPRDPSYYLAAPWSESHRAAVASLIYTPERVAAEAAKPWPGCTLPWRVRTVRMSARQARAIRSATNMASASETVVEGEAVDGAGDVQGERKRCRPGKKKWMVIRGRQRAKVLAEEAEREKKTRRNREKKVKKREREKAKKTGAGGNSEKADEVELEENDEGTDVPSS